MHDWIGLVIYIHGRHVPKDIFPILPPHEP